MIVDNDIKAATNEMIAFACINFHYAKSAPAGRKMSFAIFEEKKSEDIAEIRNWLKRGYIGRIDFYIGEIFKNSYRQQYDELIKLCKDFGGRVCMFRNHAKVMVLLGERFDAVIESSANVNTNPRTEQTIITVDSELARWYKEFFDGIKSFERNFDDVEPMII